MSTPEPSSEYPESWRPRGIPDTHDEIEPLAVEVWLASLPERDLALMLQRVRGMR